jgi:ferredoxin
MDIKELNIIIKNNIKYKIVSVNKIDCTSCTSCASNLPQYFRMDENDTSESHNNGENINQALIPEEDWELVQEEIDHCPGECIHWK